MRRPKMSYERVLTGVLACAWAGMLAVALHNATWAPVHAVATIAAWEAGRAAWRWWEGRRLTRRYGPGLPGMRLEDRKRVPYSWRCQHDDCDASIASSDPGVVAAAAASHDESEHAL